MPEAVDSNSIPVPDEHYRAFGDTVATALEMVEETQSLIEGMRHLFMSDNRESKNAAFDISTVALRLLDDLIEAIESIETIIQAEIAAKGEGK